MKNEFNITTLGDSNGRASELQFIGRGFESCLGTTVQWSY